MSAIVSIHPNLLRLPYLDKIVIGLALYHDTGKDTLVDFCILDILTPDAHKTVNTRLATYIDMAEDFHSLSQHELDQLTAYNANNIEMTKTIKLTPP